MKGAAANGGTAIARGIGFSLAFFVLVSACGVLFSNTSNFYAHSEVSAGVVVRLDNGPTHAVVTFTPAGGRTVAYQQNGTLSGFHPLQPIAVRYDRRDPVGTATTDTIEGVWGMTLLVGALSLVALGAALLNLRQSWKERHARRLPAE